MACINCGSDLKKFKRKYLKKSKKYFIALILFVSIKPVIFTTPYVSAFASTDH